MQREMYNYPQCLVLSITSQSINWDHGALTVLNWNWCSSFITSDFLLSLHHRTLQIWQLSHRMWHRTHFCLLCTPELYVFLLPTGSLPSTNYWQYGPCTAGSLQGLKDERRQLFFDNSYFESKALNTLGFFQGFLFSPVFKYNCKIRRL